MVFDLVAQVSAHEPQRRAGVEVGTAQHLPQVPVSFRLAEHVRLGEFLGAVGEMAAEDHRIGPQVADDVGDRVGLQRRLIRRAG